MNIYSNWFKCVITVLVAAVAGYQAWAAVGGTKESRLDAYLSQKFASKVLHVAVTANDVTITGQCAAASGDYTLAEIPPSEDVTELGSYPYKTLISHKSFKIVLPRYVNRYGVDYDRALSKWAIIDRRSGHDALASAARYADVVAARRSPQAIALRAKKGLAGIYTNPFMGDLDSLGVGVVTLDIHLNRLLHLGKQANDIPYSYGGRNLHVDGNEAARIDAVVESCTKRGIVVVAKLLIDVNAADTLLTPLFRHPACNGGYFAMPNLVTTSGALTFAASVNFLAERYTSGLHGRVSHWVVGSDVDAGKLWCNMGDQPLAVFSDTYVKAMRLVHNIVRQYDAGAWTLASFSHNWNTFDSNDYTVTDMLARLCRYSLVEGDFKWGMEFNAYPQDQKKPDFWHNDTLAAPAAGTKYITPRNLQVLSRWAMMPEHTYNGKARRMVLCVTGTNSPTYAVSDLEQQAAGLAWAWKKASRLMGITALLWHGWIDSPTEFGLQLGLRQEPCETLDGITVATAKPSWHAFKAAGTAQEDSVFTPYLKTVGLQAWDSIAPPRMAKSLPHGGKPQSLRFNIKKKTK